jgi:hypothetical protein
MRKNTNQVLATPNTPTADFGLFKIDVCGPLNDIVHAAYLPNYRLEVASDVTHERGTCFLRVYDSTYDQDLHDATQLHKGVQDFLSGISCGRDHHRLISSIALQDLDRSFMNAPYHSRGDWAPSQEDLFKYNASAILGVANQKVGPVHGGFIVQRASTIAYEPDHKAGPSYRFDLVLGDNLRFYAVPKSHAPHGLVPMPYAMGANLHPADREGYVRTASEAQGEFSFQGTDYVFAFVHTLFGENISGVFSKMLLGNALEATLASQFPFFMPPRGAEVGVKLLNIKFK